MAALATISGMDRKTGKRLTGLDHVRQSIMDILTTPVGSRVCRREYGSRLIDLIDTAMNAAGRQAIFAASAIAIARFYPQIMLTSVDLQVAAGGTVAILLTGQERGTARRIDASIDLPLPYPLAA